MTRARAVGPNREAGLERAGLSGNAGLRERLITAALAVIMKAKTP